MLLKELAKEYEFDCHVRELSERTIQNYTKQIAYFYNFLEQDYNITQLEDVKPIHIKSFIAKYQKLGRKPSYTNDLLKAIKCLCAYAYNEQYTPTLLTAKIKNAKEPRVLFFFFYNNYTKDFSQNRISTPFKFFCGARRQKKKASHEGRPRNVKQVIPPAAQPHPSPRRENRFFVSKHSHCIRSELQAIPNK